MNTNMLYTNKDLITQKRDVLYKRKLINIYIYAESSKTMDFLLKEYKDTISDVALHDGVVWSSKALCNMAKTKTMLTNLDYNLIRELINSLCLDGILLKRGAISVTGIKYSFALHIDRFEEFKKVLDVTINIMEKNGVVFIKDIQKMFNNTKGSYFWSKIIIDHVVWLGLGMHGPDNNILGLLEE